MRETMEETIDLRELFLILKKRIGLIISLGLLGAIAGAAISFFLLTPIFEVSTQLVVRPSLSAIESGVAESQVSPRLLNTFNEIIVSPVILEDVIRDMGLGMTPTQLQGKMRTSNRSDSQVITLSVRDADAIRAQDIANTTANVFANEVGSIMNVDNVSILSRAQAAQHLSPISPRPNLNIVIAAAAGIMLGIGLSLLLEYMDKTIKSEHDVENLIGLPVLGIIPEIDPDDMVARRNGRSNKPV